MRKRRFWRGDKRFWSPIAITSGLAIFFFGIATIPQDCVRGYVTTAAGVILLVAGFSMAPIREVSSHTENGQDGQEGEPAAGEGQSAPTESDLSTYETDRKAIGEALLDQSRSFDKYILTLSSGAFGLSFIFINEIVPNPDAATIGFLIAAWSLFALSILSTLGSFLFSQRACLRQLDLLYHWLVNKSSHSSQDQRNVYTETTWWLNLVSMATFVVGVVMLMTFGVLNIVS